MELPQDFIEKTKPLLGDEWDAFLAEYENSNYHALRMNLTKVPQEEAPAVLGWLGIPDAEPVPWAIEGYYYDDEAVAPGKSILHEAGLYYIQEPSAMSVAAMLAPEPGMKVLDLCAAPGGKTTQVLSYLQGKGLLVSNEIHPQRAKILAQNVERMGAANCLVTNLDSDTLAARFAGFFDAIVVDAPCSGEGMFRKNDQALTEWSLENVKMCAKRQEGILENASTMLAPGGRMVYSTCTFSVEENEKQMEHFLEAHPDYQLIQTERFWPHRQKGEGHFVALLKKQGSLPLTDLHPGSGSGEKHPDKNQEKALREFLGDAVTEEYASYLLSGNLVLFGDQLYRLPDGIDSVRGLTVTRAGLQIGEFKKNRFEPSHALALALSRSEVQRSYSFPADSQEAARYLRGESLMADAGEVSNGWCLMCVEGYSIGWAKATNGQLKNHYPKGLRRA